MPVGKLVEFIRYWELALQPARVRQRGHLSSIELEGRSYRKLYRQLWRLG
ncbi:MAG: hypothetical protein MUE44_18255 [Oscillatoriaceae cyanobacterium Prado104]|nr:hypothetical protein [Oscillatoriaceae cyanobacterium Prado104]